MRLGARVVTMPPMPSEALHRRGPLSRVPVMNSWQRLVAVVGLVVALGLALFPTWEVRYYSNGHPSSRSPVTTRAWVFSPEGSAAMQPTMEFSAIARLSWPRFGLDQGIVWVPTIAIILLLRRKRRPAARRGGLPGRLAPPLFEHPPQADAAEGDHGRLKK